MAATNPFDQFDGGNAFDQFDKPTAKPAGAIRRVADSGLALAKGVVGVPEAAVGVADLVTGGRAGKAVEGLGVRFKDAKQVLTGLQSDEQHAADAEVQAADGFLPTLGAMVKNPSTIANAVLESAPSMILGGGVARGAMAAIPKLGAIGAGALGEGVVAAGQNAEQVRQEDPTGTLTGGQSGVLAGSGAVTGAISRLSGGIANRLGVGDVQTMLAAGKTGAVGEQAIARGARKGVIRKIGEGALVEGGSQELPQSAQEQAAQNIAQGKPVGEGVGAAAAQGLLVGGVTGGIAGPLGGREAAPVPVAPPAGPMARAAPVVRVDSEGGARMDGAPPPVTDEPAANVQGRAPIAPEPAGPLTRALPAPAVTVDEQGNALTTEQRNEMLGAQPEPGPRETGATGRGRNSEPVQPPAARAPQLPFDNSPTGTLVAGPDGVMVQRRPEVVARANAQRIHAGDILGEKDQPFNGAIAAARAARLAGPSYSPVKIGLGKYVVRRAQDVTDVEVKTGPAAAETGSAASAPAATAVQASPQPGTQPATTAVQAGTPASERTQAGMSEQGSSSVPEASTSVAKEPANVTPAQTTQAAAPVPAPAPAATPVQPQPAGGGEAVATGTEKQPNVALNDQTRTQAPSPEAAADQAPAPAGIPAEPAGAAVSAAPGPKPEVEAAGLKPLTLGITPGNAEPVTVKNGIVHIGKGEALNFDSGEPIKVADGASHAQIKQALKDGGALSRRQKFYGGQDTGTTAAALPQENTPQSSAPTNATSGVESTLKEAENATDEPAAQTASPLADSAASDAAPAGAKGAAVGDGSNRNSDAVGTPPNGQGQASAVAPDPQRQIVDLRKRESVLKSLRACLGA